MDPLIYARWSADDESFVWPDGPYDVFTAYGLARAEEDLSSGGYFNSDDFTHWREMPAPPAPEALEVP